MKKSLGRATKLVGSLLFLTVVISFLWNVTYAQNNNNLQKRATHTSGVVSSGQNDEKTTNSDNNTIRDEINKAEVTDTSPVFSATASGKGAKHQLTLSNYYGQLTDQYLKVHSNVTVKLMGSVATDSEKFEDKVLATTKTDANGYYSFKDVTLEYDDVYDSAKDVTVAKAKMWLKYDIDVYGNSAASMPSPARTMKWNGCSGKDENGKFYDLKLLEGFAGNERYLAYAGQTMPGNTPSKKGLQGRFTIGTTFLPEIMQLNTQHFVEENYVNSVDNSILKTEATEFTMGSFYYKRVAETIKDEKGRTYTYKGYRIGSPTEGILNKNTIVSIVSLDTKSSKLYFIYEPDWSQVETKHVMKDGSKLKEDSEVTDVIDLSKSSTFTTKRNTQKGIAPLYVTVKTADGKETTVATAKKGAPIDDYTLDLQRGLVTEVTYHYDQDPDNDGVPDYQAKEHYIDETGAEVVASKIYDHIAYNETFTPHGALNPTPHAYYYRGYKFGVDGDMIEGTKPDDFTMDKDIEIYYVYEKKLIYRVDISYEYKDGTALEGNQTLEVFEGDSLGITTAGVHIPTFDQKVFTHWKDNTGAVQEGLLVLEDIRENQKITLVYAQDLDNNGVEDFNIIQRYQTLDGKKLLNTTTVFVNKGEMYKVEPRAITGYDYKRYTAAEADNSSDPRKDIKEKMPPLQTGKIIPNIQSDQVVTMQYEIHTYKVKVSVVTKDGKTIEKGKYNTNTTRKYQESYREKILKLGNMEFQYWTLNGKKQKNNTIKISKIAQDIEIQIVYEELEEEESYTLVFDGETKTVKSGESVKCTMNSSGNDSGSTVENFAIMNKLPKGIDFKGASLPAFANGTGITYNVEYYTNQRGRTVLHSNVAADSAFSFEIPELAEGEYVTLISFEFGTVPAAFAVDETVTLSFQVWKTPPAENLINISIMSFVDKKNEQ